ncbi:acetyltransferase [Lactobacillus amylovorus]|jgi:putative acetyltransferase|uniref:Acetyltransferase n=1 Tax=Lactobacillus amylovorus TaxID=1604 RepID=F0TJ51_LACAM|nr:MULTISPECIES: GNAT family N-acetyltransferase [Lactobacillus]ADZ06708.1 acetyltransferase [Lactobacillus amylovorus]ATO53550.1 GNAT family N-acetyltransferase [Lactobacillus amylovorus DSM 20531]KRK41333.1 hypothetical protein FC63_GL001456 [Lactobacillus amylovorus DSM 20531]MCT3592270.1 GNAT family N-acetyltransferase [Lactobacillus amylovorus]MDB6223798.1 GNAT family N-acetyltransferase [Lactobacillus amylovorus]
MILREYKSADCAQLAQLFYETVHTINILDYSPEQMDAWAHKEIDLPKWDASFRAHKRIVAIDKKQIVGFGDIDKSGYLDRLFVHKDYQGQGIASAICDELESSIKDGKIVTHASITARPFFKARGYIVVRKQKVVRDGIELINFVMEKK